MNEPPFFTVPSSLVWNIPYPRNPFFTGRDELLVHMHSRLQVSPQAISGIGGIGKTQIAVEYAYRYHQEYETVLWITAETLETLTASYQTIATILRLPEQEAMNVTREAVKEWLQTHHKWLLIVDNANDLDLLPAFLPPLGHILITTCAFHTQVVAQRIELEPLSDAQGAFLLLQSSGLLAYEAPFEQAVPEDQQRALAISRELGGLPLALAQTAAYLEATGISLEGYQEIYQHHRADLLQERGGLDHPKSVATTWLLAFHQIEQHNAAAASLLRLLAFLAPDPLDETMLCGGVLGTVLADHAQFEQAIEALLTCSFIKRDTSQKTLTVRRLVQAVIQDTLPHAGQQEWRQRVILLLSTAFPRVQFEVWTTCERCLPHALRCAQWIGDYQMVSPEAVRLLTRVGFYLTVRARYGEAELMLQQVPAKALQKLGEAHPSTATSLNVLAYLYELQGRYMEAEPIYQRALVIREVQLGAEHPSTATSLSNLALLYARQGRYGEAEPLLQRALAIREQHLGAEHPRTATSLNNLAYLYRNQGKYADAGLLSIRALDLRERQLGAMHPDTATSLNNLAVLYELQKKYTEAEALLHRALTIRKEQLGQMHPDTATTFHNLASVYQHQGRLTEALPLYRQALTVRLQKLGATHPDTQATRAAMVG